MSVILVIRVRVWVRIGIRVRGPPSLEKLQPTTEMSLQFLQSNPPGISPIAVAPSWRKSG